MAWDDGIEGVHKEIAASQESRIGILAGPGTGKTNFGLMRRVARLLEDGIPGDRILLLSFTRVAAADLRDKIERVVAPGVENVRATTLHGYCFGLLNQESILTITGRNPRILLAHEADLMLRDIGGDFGNIHERRRLLRAFVAGWARGLQDHPGIASIGEDRTFEHSVMLWLRNHKAMLIGEVVPEAYKFLSTNPQADALHAYDHIIVDEYQDLNVIEQRLLDVLAADSNLCIAGDDDQSIYSVRYANPGGILSFIQQEDTESHTIQQCGRCPKQILSVANCLISNAPGRAKEDLVSRDETQQGDVAIVQWPNVDAEVEGIVAAIAGDIGTQRREPGDILVLTNWRKIGTRIQEKLVELDIPARSYFTEEELSADDAKEGLALLRLLVNTEDAPALRVLLGLGEQDGRTDAYKRLLAYCHENSARPHAVLDRLISGEKLKLNVSGLTKAYSHAKSKVEQLRLLELPQVVDSLFPDGSKEVAELRAAALDAMGEAETPNDILKTIIEVITQDDVPQNPDFVRIMSLHKSKGLTSPGVYIVGAIQGVLPTIMETDPKAVDDAICEGRRLFYVAVTRAAQELVISSSILIDLADARARNIRFDNKSIRRNVHGYTVRSIASPYVAELGSTAPSPIRGQDWLQSRR